MSPYSKFWSTVAWFGFALVEASFEAVKFAPVKVQVYVVVLNTSSTLAWAGIAAWVAVLATPAVAALAGVVTVQPQSPPAMVH
jgi:hypothetical protein